uniref:rRNA N-glycosylase n=1 Tax=Volkameria aculeata TaxID=54208 RepID=P93077_9LAMI|nr:antiviral protein [Volkameria aculeata]CAA65402.1 antiviral protein [Volkameria aculeata]
MKASLVMTMIFGLGVLHMFEFARAQTPAIFHVGGATISIYTTFINTLREAAKDASLRCYGIPMLPPTTQQPKHVLTRLDADAATTITLIYNRTNLYVLGYSDPFNGECRYHIFSDVRGTDRTEAVDTLCPDRENRVQKDINFESNYQSMENKAGKSRAQLELGINILKSSIEKISGVRAFTEKVEAEFLLVAIQMTAEAARYKYIENLVKTNFNRNFKPDHKMLRLELTWGKISTPIRNAQNGVISPPLNLNSSGEDPWWVTRVDEIKPYIALLNFNSGTCQIDLNAILMSSQLDNVTFVAA